MRGNVYEIKIITWLQNSVPLSNMIAYGKPYNVTDCNIDLATVIASLLGKGKATGHFENRSVHLKMYQQNQCQRIPKFYESKRNLSLINTA